MKKVGLVLVVFLIAGAIANFAAAGYRDCVNCGVNCAPGSCDQSSSCANCYIYDCVIHGKPGDLFCGQVPPGR